MLLLLALACSPKEVPVCETFADAPTEADGTLSNPDSCGWWSLVVGDQLIVSVEMTEPDHECEATLGAGLDLPYSPIYTNLENDVPKMTFQVVGAEVAEASEVEIGCTEGTAWAAKVDVVP